MRMKMDAIASKPRRPTNVSLPAELLAEARELGVNVSKACGAGLETEVRRARAAKWLEENRAALESSNRWVEEHGLPLAKYRPF